MLPQATEVCKPGVPGRQHFKVCMTNGKCTGLRTCMVVQEAQSIQMLTLIQHACRQHFNYCHTRIAVNVLAVIMYL